MPSKELTANAAKAEIVKKYAREYLPCKLSTCSDIQLLENDVWGALNGEYREAFSYYSDSALRDLMFDLVNEIEETIESYKDRIDADVAIFCKTLRLPDLTWL